MPQATAAGSSTGPTSAADKPLPKKSQVDIRDLAERVFKLLKEQARLEAEREGRLKP
jgi:hypothetical protein